MIRPKTSGSKVEEVGGGGPVWVNYVQNLNRIPVRPGSPGPESRWKSWSDRQCPSVDTYVRSSTGSKSGRGPKSGRLSVQPGVSGPEVQTGSCSGKGHRGGRSDRRRWGMNSLGSKVLVGLCRVVIWSRVTGSDILVKTPGSKVRSWVYDS